MIFTGYEMIDELEKLKCDYEREILQLEKLHTRLHERRLKFIESNALEENVKYGLIENTEKILRNIEEALNNLYEAVTGTIELIKQYRLS